LVAGGNARRFVLQAVARPHFHDGDAGRKVHVKSIRPTSGWTSSPGRQLTAATVPSPGARTGSSIFIASRTINTSPRFTASPCATFTAVTVAGIGAVTDP